jgi:hypothetical protein
MLSLDFSQNQIIFVLFLFIAYNYFLCGSPFCYGKAVEKFNPNSKDDDIYTLMLIGILSAQTNPTDSQTVFTYTKKKYGLKTFSKSLDDLNTYTKTINKKLGTNITAFH